MANVGDIVRRLAAELSIVDKTGEGAASAEGNFRKVGEAAQGAATVVEKNEKITESAERAYQRLQRRLDPLATAEQKFRRDQDALTRALDQGVIGADRYEKNLRQLNSQFEATRERIERTERAQSGLGKTFREFGPVVNQLKGLIVGFFAAFSFREIISGAREAVSAMDDIAKKARTLGGIQTAGFLQEARFALGQQGFDSAESIDKALAKFNKNIGDLVSGNTSSKLTTILKNLSGGPQLQAALENAKTLEERYKIFIEALHQIPDAATRAAVASAALGKEAAQKIGGAAEGGVKGIEELIREAKAAGLVIEDDLLVKAEHLNDRFEKAGQVLSVQWTRALIELGPIMAGLEEAAARFLKSIVDGIRTAQLANAAPAEVAGASGPEGLQAQKAAIEKTIGDLEKNRGYLDARFGIATPRIAQLNAKLGEVQKNIDILARGGIASVGQLMQALGEDAGKAAGGIGESADALADAQEKLAQLEQRLAAAKQGPKALAAFDAKAAIDQAIAASGFTGAAADQLRAVLEKEDDVAAATKKVTDAFKQAGEAAAAVKFDPLADAAANPQHLQELVDAMKIGPEEVARAKERFQIESDIASLKIEAAKAAASEDRAAFDAALKHIGDLQDRLKNLAPAAVTGDSAAPKRGFWSLANEWADEFARASDRFWDDFVRTGKFNLKDLGRTLKSILLDSAIDPVHTLTRQIFSSLGGGLTGAISGKAGEGGAGALNFAGITIAGTPLTQYLGTAFAGAALSSAALGAIGIENKNSQKIGTAAGALFGALPGAIIGALSSLFNGKPSDKVGQTVFNPATGANLGTGQKDNSAASNSNLQIAQGIEQAISKTVSAIVSASGGSIGDLLLNVAAGKRDGIRIGPQGPQGQILNPQKFANSEEGAQQAIDAGVRLALASLKTDFPEVDKFVAAALKKKLPIEDIASGVEQLSGLFKAVDQLSDKAKSAVTKFVGAAVAAGQPVANVVESAQKVADVLSATAEPVDQYAASTKAITDAIGPLIDQFKELKLSTKDLVDAQKQALGALAAQANKETAQAQLEIDNPAAAQAKALLDELTSRKAGLEDLAAAGGNVDLSAYDTLARSQLLGQFNLDRRLSEGADPAKASVEQFRDTQAKELAALKSLVGQFGIGEGDVEKLIRAQSFERQTFFDQLSPEDKVRLAGQTSDFASLDQQYGAAVDNLLAHTKDLVDGFDAEQQRLQGVVDKADRTVADYNAALEALPQSGTPKKQIGSLRQTAEDLLARATSSTDGADRDLARQNLPGALNDLIQRTEQVYASGPQRDAAIAFARDALTEVRDQAASEKSAAQAQLDTLVESRDILANIRDILAASSLDPEALAQAAQSLPEGYAGKTDVVSLVQRVLDIAAQQQGLNAQLTAALAALTPADIGLTAPDGPPPASEGFSDARTQPAPAAPAPLGAYAPAPPPAPVGAPAGGGSAAPNRDSEIKAGLAALADAIDSQTATIIELDKRRRPGETRSENYLKTIATTRSTKIA